MKVLFITPYPTGKAPSQRFRFEQYFELLKSNGITVEKSSFFSESDYTILYLNGHIVRKFWVVFQSFIKRLFYIFKSYKFDYVFIHREASPLGPPIFEWIIVKILNKKIIYDFDDAIWLEDPGETGSLQAKLKWKSKVARICKWSHKVSVGNDYLAKFAVNYNNNVIINPTTIDVRNLHNPSLHQHQLFKKPKTKLTIGWTGTHSTLTYLQDIVPIIKQLESEYDFEFLIIANKNPEFELRSFRFIPWMKESEISDLLKMDIGIMPLSDDKWSKGKCGFKLLQYMSLEIPSIASPMGVNSNIITQGENGFLCYTKKEWKESLELLVKDPILRKRIGHQGRKIVEKNYSVEANEDNFLSLFE